MNKKLLMGLFVSVIGFMACKKNLPENRLSLSPDSKYLTYTYRPVLGRTTLFSDNFQYGNSSRPLDFKIVNMRAFSGENAPELNNFYPVSVWKETYNGTETSLAAINAKRKIENHKLFEIREHSGEFFMWAEANSNMISAQPDSGYVFDVELSNTGGRKYFKNLRLLPFRERNFEPSNLDPITGLATNVGISVSDVFIATAKTQRNYSRNEVQVIFKENIPPAGQASGNSLTFRFVDSLFNPINPNKFSGTDWSNLVHGFNFKMDAEKVTYEVAYPIPCTNYPTKYTTKDGRQARVVFRFDRIGFGNTLQKNFLIQNFNLYKKGDWEMIFWFKTDQPKFDND